MDADCNFFEVYQIEKLSHDEIDQKLASTSDLVCFFLWGKDCPNCEVAKKVLIDRKDDVENLKLRWFHADVYEDFEIATRFGLIGIPSFLFFKNGKKLGKISPFPGFDPFYDAVKKLQTREI